MYGRTPRIGWRGKTPSYSYFSDQAKHNWMMTMQWARAKSRAMRPGMQVARLRSVVRAVGLEIVYAEWMPDPSIPLFVDIYARWEKEDRALAIDGWAVGKVTRHRFSIERKDEILTRLGIPYLCLKDKDPAVLEVKLRTWMMKLSRAWAAGLEPAGAAWDPALWVSARSSFLASGAAGAGPVPAGPGFVLRPIGTEDQGHSHGLER